MKLKPKVVISISIIGLALGMTIGYFLEAGRLKNNSSLTITTPRILVSPPSYPPGINPPRTLPPK